MVLLLTKTSLRCFGSWEAWPGLGRSLRQSFLIPMLCQWSRSQPIARRSAKICRMKSIRPCRRKSWFPLDYVKKVHEKGNPILVFAGSVEMSILYSNLLCGKGSLTIFSMLTMLLERPRSLRNQVEKELWRLRPQWPVGEPISLGPGSRWVRWLGGCWDWADDEPADWPSNSWTFRVVKEIPVWPKFFVSLEDDLMKNWGPDWIQGYLSRLWCGWADWFSQSSDQAQV